MHTLYRKVFLLCFVVFASFVANAQKAGISVNGTVKDGQGSPVIQAVVLLEGSQIGTVTDLDGNFSIQAPEDGYLVIMHLGFDTLRTSVKSQLNITLQASSNSLKDLVVIGYGSVGKEELTGSVAKVDEKDFQEGTVSTPEQLIAGKVAGASITSNGGSPGAGSTIRIRGFASLNASQNPLIIIDGLPINQDDNVAGTSNSLSLINPDDIESFTILKDGASTAIYGSRASNGVILITTKKGKKGKPEFSFTTHTSVSTIGKEQSVQSAAAFRSYVTNSPYGSTSIGTVPFSSLLGTANTNWQDQIYRKAAPTTDDNFSVSGSLKNLPYRISLSYLDQNGLLKTDNLQRYSGAISLSPSLLHDNLKITLNLKASDENVRFANEAAISSAVYFDPTQPVYQKGSPYGGYYEWASGGTLNNLAPRNPVALLNLYNNTAAVFRSYGNVTFDYKIPGIDGLHANLNLGYDISNSSGMVYVPANAAQSYVDSGQHNPYHNATSNTVTEAYLNYNKTINSIKSNINATAGYGFYDFREYDNYFYSYRANGDTIGGSKPVVTLYDPENTLLSYYARLIYTFNVKYILAASVRQDQSSRFPNEGASGVMPSVAFTWRINKENALKSSKYLSLLNLRLSYGVTGNQAGIANYAYESVYGQSGNSSLQQFGSSYYNMGTPSAFNTNIVWEKTQASNIGIDYGFFNDRITGSIDAYYKNTTNLLDQTLPVPAGVNFSNVLYGNAGTMNNKGVEFTINATPVKTKRFQWDISFNVAYNENKVTALSEGVPQLYSNGVQINEVGSSLGEFYVYHQQYDKNGKPIEGVYADINGDGVINSKDQYLDHSPFPKLIYGFTTKVSLDKWTLTTVLRANTGNYMYNSVAAGASQANVFNALGYLANTSTSLTSTNFYYNQPMSDYYIQNASFLKMDNLSLAYNFGKVFKSRLRISVDVYCQNVFTITKYTGIDPEIYGGYDAALYPRPRIYGIGGNIKF